MSVHVTVKVKKRKEGSNGWNVGTEGITVQGNTESAVMDALKKRHPGYEIVILEIK